MTNSEERAFLWFACPYCGQKAIYQVLGQYKYDSNNKIYFQSKRHGIINFEHPDERQNNSYNYPLVVDGIICRKCCAKEGKQFPEEYNPVIPTLDNCGSVREEDGKLIIEPSKEGREDNVT